MPPNAVTLKYIVKSGITVACNEENGLGEGERANRRWFPLRFEIQGVALAA